MPHRAQRTAGDVPVPSTAFVGRRQQIQDTVARLKVARLVTLLGPGGMGKTRLAQQVGQRSRRSVTVRWVQFADLDRSTTAEILEQTVAEACGVRDFSAGAPWDTLIDTLAERRHLLILDNAERVIDQAGALVSDLLAAVPNLRIVATSRQPLSCYGEHRLQVPPLTDDEAW
jgi:predicted ATPase